MNSEFLNDPLLHHFSEALAADVNDDHVDYARVWSIVDDRIENAEKLGNLCLVKKEEIASEAMWESVEASLYNRIHEYSEFDEPVDACIKNDVALPQSVGDEVRSELNNRIDILETISVWEQRLKQENILPLGTWEKIEQNLNDKIDNYNNFSKPKTTFLSFSAFKPLRAVAALLILSVGVLTGYYALKQKTESVPTYVYFSQGTDALSVQKASPLQKSYSSSMGGVVRIANDHGYVVLENGASLAIAKATPKEARYKLHLAMNQPSHARSTVDFYVLPHHEGKKFILSTDEYTIKVVGTYFRCLTDSNGHTSTQVLDGTVRIQLPKGERTVEAGQSLVYNQEHETYEVVGGGEIVSKANVEPMPNINAIATSGMLSVTSSISGAQVFVNGQYNGIAPLSVLVSSGLQRITIDKQGYSALDTVIEIRQGPMQYLVANLSQTIIDIPVPLKPLLPVRTITKPVAVDTTQDLLLTDLHVLLNNAAHLERNDYRAALEQYKIIFAMKNSSPLVQQTALFSIGKIQADKVGDKKLAKESFLTYLTLFPQGNFASEALLRLAEIELSNSPDTAIAYYQKFIQNYPTNYKVAELEYRVGLLQVQKKRYGEGILFLKKSLADMNASQTDMKEKVLKSLYRAQIEQDSLQSRSVFK